MKKFLFLSILATLLLNACKDHELDPTLRLGDGPVLTNPVFGTNFELTEDQGADIFTNFTWTAADFGFDAAVTYTLQLDVNGNDFADAVTVGAVNGLSLGSITNSKINTMLLSKGLPGETPALIDFRIAANVNPNVATVYSAPVTVSITPYTVVIIYPQLQVPGSYQGWNPGDNNTVIYSVKSDNKYEGYIYFADPNTQFKYTEGPSWDVNWGDTGADGNLDAGGDNLVATDAGMYKLNVDLNDHTQYFTKTDWGLIGSATPNGWDSDQNMSYDAANNKLTITLDLVAGDIKFRANDDWAINFGDDDANLSLEYGGANIAIAEAGNYTIDLILNRAVYTYKVTKN